VVAKSTRGQFGIPEKSKALPKSTPGRICRQDGCDTVLSIYNSALECYFHEPRLPKGRRGPL
jgi:hypothetical protein